MYITQGFQYFSSLPVLHYLQGGTCTFDQNLNNFHEYLIQCYLKSGGTRDQRIIKDLYFILCYFIKSFLDLQSFFVHCILKIKGSNPYYTLLALIRLSGTLKI